MTKLIIMLILHIISTIICLILSVTTNNKTSKVLWAICSVLWSICIGFDICNLYDLSE